MKINIFSENNIFKIEKIKILKIYFNKNSFQIMKNYVSSIGDIDFLLFYFKNKFYKINLRNSFFIHKKKEIKIICDDYVII